MGGVVGGGGVGIWVPIENRQLGFRAFPQPGEGPGAVGTTQKAHRSSDELRMFFPQRDGILIKTVESGIEINVALLS